MKKFLSLILFTLVASGVASANSTWAINRDHSEIRFEVDYLKVSEVSGRFKIFSGNVILNDQEIPKQIVLKIATVSVDTGNNLRDGHLKSNAFFQTKEHPFIFFKSDLIQNVSAGNFKAKGELLIKGFSKNVTIDFSLSDTMTDTWGNKNKFAKFNSKINRTAFNLKWNKTIENQKYLVGDVVTLTGVFQLQPNSAMTPSSKHMLPDTSYIRGRERMVRGEINMPEPKTEVFQKLPGRVNSVVLNQIGSLTNQVKPKEDNHRDNLLWWVSLWTIGLLGFFAVIIISFYSKNLLADYFPRKYEENGILGYVSDLLVIFYVILYSLSFWFLGWGVR